MNAQRYMMVYPIPQALGAAAASLQGVQYFAKTACLLVPAQQFVEYAKGILPTTPSAADLALNQAVSGYLAQPINTMPLTTKVATAATKATHRVRQHHFAITRNPLVITIVLTLVHLLWRCLLVLVKAVIKFPFKLAMLLLLILGQRLMQPSHAVTGKHSTKNYQ